MMKKVWNKKVSLMGDTFTIGEIVMVSLGLLMFVMLVGMAEHMGRVIENGL